MRYRETHSLLGAMQRALAPLQIQRLKPHYRLQIAEQGFVVAYQHLANFSAQINRQPAE